MTSRQLIASPDGTAQIAASLVRFGMQVFPVQVEETTADDGTLSRSKRPLVNAWPETAAAADQATIWDWWELFPHAWIGLSCGGSGVVAVDIDRKHGKDGFAALEANGVSLPATLRYTTVSGDGEHHLFRAPDGAWTIGQDVRGPSGSQMVGVDIRAGVGFVLYNGPKWTEPATLAHPPGWALLPATPPSTKSPTSVQEFRAALMPGPMSPGVLEELATVTPTGMSHQDMLNSTLSLVRRGANGAPGVATALDVGRSVYTSDCDARFYGRAWDDAVEGAIKRVGMPGENELEDDLFPTRTIEPGALDRYEDVARRWLGADFDLQAAHAVLAAAAVEQLPGEPVWLLTVSGSGNAKTETLKGLTAANAEVISTISGEGALLSGTSRKEKAANATGGILRKVGPRGIIAIKDVTSILSMHRDRRAEILAALREVYDGHWVRHLGTDGGTSLEWSGRLVVVGAVTSAWDKAHSVISAMGDRFVLVRPSSRGGGRITAARQVLRNTGREAEMASEMANAVGEVLASVDASQVHELTEQETERLIEAANLITLGRTAVDRDYQGNPVSADEPEMPTRFIRQLQQVFRGGVAIGLDRRDAFRLAMRCARDSMPPLRLELLEQIALFSEASVTDVVKALDKPRSTIDRELQALHLLGLLTKRESPLTTSQTRPWVYDLARGVSIEALSPEMSGPQHTPLINPDSPYIDISGDATRSSDFGPFDDAPVGAH